MSSVTSATSATSTASTIAELNSTNGATGDSSLDEADFLKLLTAQLAAQDPLNPESNTDFIAQMASFSQLKEMNTVSGNMSQVTASNYIGKTVTASDSSGNSVTGVVSSISIADGDVSLDVNGTTCALDTVTKVSNTTSSTTTTNSTTTE
jgi:flagellar basal-body rod modification protein FlgD